MSFASDAQRKHFFANNGGSGGGSGVPTFPEVGDGQYVHTIKVNGVDRYVVLDESDRATPEERRESDLKEIRKDEF